MMNRIQWEEEVLAIKMSEIQFLKKNNFSGTDYLNKKISGVIPFEIEDKLNVAFRKSFAVIFELGGKNKYKSSSADNSDFSVSQNLSSQSKNNHLIFSGVEGIGFGILGIGLPDIPVFIGVLNRNIKKIAQSYGFTIDNEREKIFILKIITAAFGDINLKKQENLNIGNMIIKKDYPLPTLKKSIEYAAKALAEEMLYLKFVQGIPFLGVIGGISNPICINKVSKYADIVYKKRFLYRIGKENGFI